MRRRAQRERVKVNGLLIIFDIWWSLKIIMKGCCLNTSCTWIVSYQRSAARKFRRKNKINRALPTLYISRSKNFRFPLGSNNFSMLIDAEPAPSCHADDYFFSKFLRQNKKKHIYRRRCIASLNKQNFDALLMRILDRFSPAVSLFNFPPLS